MIVLEVYFLVPYFIYLQVTLDRGHILYLPAVFYSILVI